MAAAALLAGCAQQPKAYEPKLVGSDFCKIQREKLSWSVRDTKETIGGIQKFNAKHDSRCRGKAMS